MWETRAHVARLAPDAGLRESVPPGLTRIRLKFSATERLTSLRVFICPMPFKQPKEQEAELKVLYTTNRQEAVGPRTGSLRGSSASAYPNCLCSCKCGWKKEWGILGLRRDEVFFATAKVIPTGGAGGEKTGEWTHFPPLALEAPAQANRLRDVLI